MKTINLQRLCAGGAIFLALALQIQLSIFKTTSYEGLRIGLGDFLLPFAGIAILFSLLRKHSMWPQWQKPFGVWALAAPTLAIIFALFTAWHLHGEISAWAMINKFSGWLVILCYFGLGAWLKTNSDNNLSETFLKFFISAFTAIAFLEIFNQIMRSFGLEPEIRYYYSAPEGLMGNRNAFAFLFLNVSAFLTILNHHNKIVPTKFLFVFWLLFPTLMLFNGSRMLIICVPFLLIFLTILDWKKTVKVILPGLALGILIFFALFSAEQKDFFLGTTYKVSSSIYTSLKNPQDSAAQEIMQRSGNNARLIILKDSFNLIQQHPLTGAGLGGALYTQEKTYGKRIDVIDSTPLWIFTDMGAIGFTAFLAAYLVIAHSLVLRALQKQSGFDKTLALCAVTMVASFALFSLFHELLYTRFFWFILGLALSVRPGRSEDQVLPDQKHPL